MQKSLGMLMPQPLLWLQQFGAVWMRFTLPWLAAAAAGVAKADTMDKTDIPCGMGNLPQGLGKRRGPGCSAYRSVGESPPHGAITAGAGLLALS